MCSLGELNDRYKAIAKQENVIDPEIVIKKGSDKGDNYMGELQVVNITGKNKSLYLITKCAPKEMELRKQSKTKQAFNNEILFYEEIYPMLKKFQNEHNVKQPFKGIPKCYITSSKECEEFIVMENVRENGYTMWNRKIPMNREHVVIVFKDYAKFHALSFAMKDQMPELFQEKCLKMHNINEAFFENEMEIQGFKTITDKLKIQINEAFNDDNINQLFGSVCDNTVETLSGLKDIDKKYCVIIHGDCWCNNMLFKYVDQKNLSPVSMKIIDWQIIQTGPPVLDLSHFLYCCTSKDIYDDLDNLLRIYHDTLIEQVTQLGTDPKKIMSFETLKDLWKLHSKYGLMMAFVTLKIMLSDSDETPDVSNSTKNGGTFLEAFDYVSKNEEEYKKRLNDVVLHMYNNKFL